MESWECRWQRPLVEPAWPPSASGPAALTVWHPKGRRPGLQRGWGPESWLGAEVLSSFLFNARLRLSPRRPPECFRGLLCLSGCTRGAPGSILQVANVNAKDGTCTLKDCVYKDVQKDWPGYSEGDQQLLKRMLIR